MAGFLGGLWWPLDLASHFRVQYLGASCVLAILYLVGRRVREVAVSGLLVAVNATLVVPLYLRPPGAGQAAGPVVRLMLVNVNTHHGDPARVEALVRQVDPDVLVLEEVSLTWISALREVRERLAHDVVEPRGDNFGIGMWCRTKPTRAEIVYLGPAEVPSIFAELQVGSGTLGLLATHPVPPGGAEEASWRDAQLSDVARFLGRQHLPLMLLGDLNVTPWSWHYRRLVRDTGLRRAMRGVAATWPAGLWPLRIPIDHALCSPGVRVQSATVGPDVGSDHFPLIVEAGLAPSGR